MAVPDCRHGARITLSGVKSPLDKGGPPQVNPLPLLQGDIGLIQNLLLCHNLTAVPRAFCSQAADAPLFAKANLTASSGITAKAVDRASACMALRA